jgi:hypothetical protein
MQTQKSSYQKVRRQPFGYNYCKELTGRLDFTHSTDSDFLFLIAKCLFSRSPTEGCSVVVGLFVGTGLANVELYYPMSLI